MVSFQKIVSFAGFTSFFFLNNTLKELLTQKYTQLLYTPELTVSSIFLIKVLDLLIMLKSMMKIHSFRAVMTVQSQ